MKGNRHAFLTKNQYMLELKSSTRSSAKVFLPRRSHRPHQIYRNERGILAITLQATPGTHDEGRLVLALVRATGLFLSFGEPLSYGKLLLRGLSIGSCAQSTFSLSMIVTDATREYNTSTLIAYIDHCESKLESIKIHHARPFGRA
jgi:hypothetical protein